MSIFDLITSNRIVTYWENKRENEDTYPCEELFEPNQYLGLEISWIVGADGLPVVLNESAFDVKAVPRERIGFEEKKGTMPFFKESKYIDEILRQQLNLILMSGNEKYITLITKKIFDDEIDLLRGARAQRERMRALALTTGAIAMQGNGQIYDVDYGIPSSHKKTVTKSWSDATAPILQDIKDAKQKIKEDTGVTVTRAICTSKVFGYFRKNTEIRMSLKPTVEGAGFISDASIKTFLLDELELEVVIDDYQYKNEQRQTKKYVQDDVFVLFPGGKLGEDAYGTTPEQSDLMALSVANVSITDTGVAVTTTASTDPVNVETKVTMIYLPSLPTANQIFIYDVEAAA